MTLGTEHMSVKKYRKREEEVITAYENPTKSE